MKTSSNLGRLSSLFLVVLLSGCLGKDYHTHSTVYEDGAVQRIVFTADGDSAMLWKNIFGIREGDGWRVEWQNQPKDTAGWPACQKQMLQFSRMFKSVNEANVVMHDSSSAKFKIRSEFKTTFRWFYTDFHYSDTYLATIRFKHVTADDYFSEEDFVFLNRYRGLKQKTAQDSAQFSKLDQRVDDYVEAGLATEAYLIILQIVENRTPGTTWPDSTRKYKPRIIRSLELEELSMENLTKLFVDSLKIPIRFTKEDKVQFNALDEYLVTLFDQFGHSIEMPYDIIDSNADSTAGMFAYWNNQETLVRDFTMHVKSRKVNYWAIMATVFLVAALIFVLRVRESTRIAKSLANRQ